MRLYIVYLYVRGMSMLIEYIFEIIKTLFVQPLVVALIQGMLQATGKLIELKEVAARL